MPCLSGALPCASDAFDAFDACSGAPVERGAPPLAVVDYNLQWVE